MLQGLTASLINVFLLLIKVDIEGSGICHMDSVTTILDVQGVDVAVEGAEDLPADDAVAHQEGSEEHQPPQERHDHTDRDTSPQCGCPRHKADGDPKQTHPGPLFDQLKMSSGENHVLHLKLLFESKADWAAPGSVGINWHRRTEVYSHANCTVHQQIFCKKCTHLLCAEADLITVLLLQI